MTRERWSYHSVHTVTFDDLFNHVRKPIVRRRRVILYEPLSCNRGKCGIRSSVLVGRIKRVTENLGSIVSNAAIVDARTALYTTPSATFATIFFFLFPIKNHTRL